MKTPYDRNGNKNPRWKGGRRKRKDGYILVYRPSHPFAYRNFILEHRDVMEKHLGRILNPDELVHHINEIKHDNRIENLSLTDRQEHAKIHFSGKKQPRWKPLFTEERLRELYLVEGWTLRQIAEMLNSSYGAVRRHFIEFEIEIRKSDPWWIRKNKRQRLSAS